jgi:predicted nucleic acid-binding protein
MLIFDVTPLIYLAKIDKLFLLDEIEEEKIIPEKVYEEVVEEGKKKGIADASIIEKSIERGMFTMKKAPKDSFYKKLKQNPNLSEADISVLTLAKKNQAIAIIDEDYARNIAEIEEIKNKGTIFLIFSLFKRKDIDKKDAKEMVDRMIENGWYCSIDLYAKILKKIEITNFIF